MNDQPVLNKYRSLINIDQPDIWVPAQALFTDWRLDIKLPELNNITQIPLKCICCECLTSEKYYVCGICFETVCFDCRHDNICLDCHVKRGTLDECITSVLQRLYQPGGCRYAKAEGEFKEIKTEE